MSTSNDMITHYPKQMRKGTHSCVERRRRKRRCVWPTNARKCMPCTARGNQCVEQKYGSIRPSSFNKTTLRERIHELEGTLERILAHRGVIDLPSNVHLLKLNDADVLEGQEFGTSPIATSSNLGDSSRPHTTIHSTNQRHGLEKAPLLTLFDNAILCHEASDSHEDVPFKSSRGSYGAVERNKKLLRSVRSLAPSSQALSLIVLKSHTLLCLLGKIFPDFPGLSSYCLDDSQIALLRDKLAKAFESENIGIVTKALICLAFCIQQLPVDFNLGSSTVPAPLVTIQNCYIESTESFLAPNEGVVGTIDGLECLMAEVRYYLNFGIPRKA